MPRFQVFIEDADDEGVGELADLATIEACWSWLDQRYDEGDENRLWWLKDRESEDVVSAIHCGDIWRALCENPSRFKDWLAMVFGWHCGTVNTRR